jgi:putative acetyltransferase
VTTGGLRGFAAADLASLEDLWVAAWKAIGLEIDFEARRPWLRAHLTHLMAERVEIVVGLDEAGRPAGFVTIDTNTGYLDQICVAPAAWGAGLAGELLAEAKRRAPGRIELHVNVANPRACHFYERQGFRIVGHGVSAMSALPVRHLLWVADG